jgi:putative Holliday junction resolvase
MRYLAIDLGDKRTGLAVGDDEFGTVTPLPARHQPIDEALIDVILDVADEHGVAALVLGLALNMDGTEGKRAKKSRSFAASLAERTSMALHMQDERLTSYAADQLMGQSGLTHKQKKARRDSLAAAVILSDFLNGLATGEGAADA